MKKFLLYILFLLFVILDGAVFAADIPIVPTGPVYAFANQPQLGTLAWGTSGPGGFNNNFFFVPTFFPNGSVCVYVYNNNPTNAHTFQVTLLVSGNPSNTTPSDGTWQLIPGAALNATSLTVNASPSAPSFFGAPISGISKISIGFAASTSQAGSPDTASIVVVQIPTSTCSPIVPPDPCQSQAFSKLSVPVSTSGTSLTQIVAGVAGRNIYVCGYVLGFGGTSPTLTFAYGTGANCGTGLVSLSGAIPVSTATPLAVAGSATQLIAPPGNSICIQLGGTTPTSNGYIVVASQ